MLPFNVSELFPLHCSIPRCTLEIFARHHVQGRGAELRACPVADSHLDHLSTGQKVLDTISKCEYLAIDVRL
jgi:hypothetical protein